MLNINKFNMNKFDISKLVPVQIVNGRPELIVKVEASTGSLSLKRDPKDSSVLTITVQNRLRFILHPPTVAASGSDANDVMVYIQLSSILQQVGGMVVPSGFQAAVTQDHHTVFCFGGTIPAGGSVVFEIEVIGDGLGVATILAEVDPYNLIAENLESNNTGSATIYIYEVY
jgi:hypothetical protein